MVSERFRTAFKLPKLLETELTDKAGSWIDITESSEVSRPASIFFGTRSEFPLVGRAGAKLLDEMKCNGGFSVGSNLMRQTEAALGFQLARTIFAELGYRALAFNYDNGGLLYDTITHGAQLTVGIGF